MDEELSTKLDNLIAAVTALADKMDEQQSRIDELDSVLYDGIIGPANDQISENEYNDALSDWRCKYAEKLEPFSDKLKALEGDDYDIVKASFDKFNDDEIDMDPDEFVDRVAFNIEKKVTALAKTFGASDEEAEEAGKEAAEEVKETADEGGETTVTIEKTGDDDDLKDLKDYADKAGKMLMF